MFWNFLEVFGSFSNVGNVSQTQPRSPAGKLVHGDEDYEPFLHLGNR